MVIRKNYVKTRRVKCLVSVCNHHGGRHEGNAWFVRRCIGQGDWCRESHAMSVARREENSFEIRKWLCGWEARRVVDAMFRYSERR